MQILLPLYPSLYLSSSVHPPPSRSSPLPLPPPPPLRTRIDRNPTGGELNRTDIDTRVLVIPLSSTTGEAVVFLTRTQNPLSLRSSILSPARSRPLQAIKGVRGVHKAAIFERSGVSRGGSSCCSLGSGGGHQESIKRCRKIKRLAARMKTQRAEVDETDVLLFQEACLRLTDWRTGYLTGWLTG